MNRPKTAHLSEETKGFVSIFVVLLIMIVLSLVTVGFSTVTRRAQRQTLDSQLSTQAFYAAESGINDGIAWLRRQQLADPDTVHSKPDCKLPVDPIQFNHVIDSDLDVSYSCLIVNSTPPSLHWNDVPVEGSGSPVVVAFEPEGGFDGRFDVTWAGVGSVDPIPIVSTPELPTARAWGDNLGIVRIDLVPRDSLTRVDLVENYFTFFLYPTSGGAFGVTDQVSVTNNRADKGQVELVQCAETIRCTAHVTVSPNTNARYTMRVQMLYNNASVSISKVYNDAGQQTVLKNGQAIVDATGKANDVFRRIQVYVPLEKAGYHPPFALETTGSICKRYLLGKNAVTGVDEVGVDAAYASNPDCDLN